MRYWRYRRLEETKEVLEEYDQAQLTKDRAELEKRRQAALAAEERGEEAKVELRGKERARERQQNRRRLYEAIGNAWRDRWRFGSSEAAGQAKYDVAHLVPLQKAVARQHWKTPEHRWVYIFQYFREYNAFWGSSIEEDYLVFSVAEQEEIYLETSAKEADEAELARYRKGGGRKAERTEQIKKLAATRPMNPLKDFDPGIYDYAPYPQQPQSADSDIQTGDFDSQNLTLNYSNGKKLEIPLDANLFFSKPVDQQKVLRIFTRRHKKSGRLIPFVIYERIPAVADLDLLSEDDLALIGLPRFDPALTPRIMFFLSPEFKMHKLSLAALQIASIHAQGLGLRQLGVPLASAALRTGGALVTGAVRTGGALVTGAARQVSIAVTAYGYSPVAASYLGRVAFTYYLTNAYEISMSAILITEVAINLGGGDTGGVSPGDEVSMVVAETRAAAQAAKEWTLLEGEVKEAAQAAKEWKLLEGEVKEVNLATKQAIVRVKKVAAIEENLAKQEYDLGKKLALIRKPLGQGKAKLKPDPRAPFDVVEFNRIQKQLETQLPKLAGKYNPAALNKLTNLTPDQIKEAQIHPSDLEKLYKKLNSAGETTQQFINSFHDAPNFEQVVLNWAKSQVWTKAGEWQRTQSMRSGTYFLMKYCVANLQGRKVRFEWPQGIKHTSWGEEIWARYVDVVVEDGSRVKPGDTLYHELKSWTEWTLRRKTSSPYGLQYQLVRDTALFGPERIRWVFDGGKKLTKEKVIAEFLKVIKGDKYLLEKWGRDDKAIREALERVIEVFTAK